VPTRHQSPESEQSPFGGRIGLSVNEAAQSLSIDRDTIYKLIASGRLVSSLLGRRRIIHATSVTQLLRDTVVPPVPRYAAPPARVKRSSTKRPG
jgi:excisionase family DNA binding protein